MLDRIRQFRHDRYIRKLVATGLKLGQHVYLNDGFFLDPSHCHLITIEDKVVFGPCVRVFAHDASSLKVIGKTRIAPVHLKQNCFIGGGTTILPGVTIGANSIVGAGSVVTSAVPDNELWAGVPAKKLMTVEEYRSKLQALPQIDFSEQLYASESLTPERRAEMLQKLREHGSGFMKRT